MLAGMPAGNPCLVNNLSEDYHKIVQESLTPQTLHDRHPVLDSIFLALTVHNPRALARMQNHEAIVHIGCMLELRNLLARRDVVRADQGIEQSTSMIQWHGRRWKVCLSGELSRRKELCCMRVPVTMYRGPCTYISSSSPLLFAREHSQFILCA